MTKETAQEYILTVLLDAATAAGGKSALAREFGVRPAAVSQWLKRRRFPVRLAYRMQKLVGDKHDLGAITKAILIQTWPQGAEKGKVS